MYPLANIFPFLPSFSPWKSPFYSAFMTVNQISHICRIMQYLSFYVWLISLDIMPSKFIHVVSMSGFSCFPSIMYIYLYPFIHPVDKKFQVRRETEITFFYCYEFFSICWRRASKDVFGVLIAILIPNISIIILIPNTNT